MAQSWSIISRTSACIIHEQGRCRTINLQFSGRLVRRYAGRISELGITCYNAEVVSVVERYTSIGPLRYCRKFSFIASRHRDCSSCKRLLVTRGELPWNLSANGLRGGRFSVP